MSGSAALYAERAHPDARADLPSGETFACSDGRWAREGPMAKIAPSKDPGPIMHAIDAGIRNQLNAQPPLKPRSIPKYAQAIVDDRVQRCINRIQAARAARATTGRTKLPGIRHAASRTEEALLADKERDFGGEGAWAQVEAGRSSGTKRGEKAGRTAGTGQTSIQKPSCDETSSHGGAPSCGNGGDASAVAAVPSTGVCEDSPPADAMPASVAPAVAPAKPSEAPKVSLNEQRRKPVEGLLDGVFDRAAFEKTGAMTALAADQANEMLFARRCPSVSPPFSSTHSRAALCGDVDVVIAARVDRG